MFQQPDDVACRVDEVPVIPAAEPRHQRVDGAKDIADEQETPHLHTDTLRAVAGCRVPFEEISPAQGDGLPVEGNGDGRSEFLRRDRDALL